MSATMKAMAALGTGAVESMEPEVRTRAQPATSDAATDWLCAWCLNRVANERDRFTCDGRSEFTFTNPHGVCFHIVTFARTLGCEDVGTPTFEDTWFPQHAWSHCLCDRCQNHLGWHYVGPNEFAGLIRDRIVRAATVRN